MTSRVSSKNKEKKAKRKNSVKKETKQEKKNGTKKQKTASPGVEPGLSARSKFGKCQVHESRLSSIIDLLNINILLSYWGSLLMKC